ncbi:ABC transporter substrate-binding protein [Brevundimonas sp.]|uniref:ABC transporter substrate-binding protein n=1 Tax=Brevundimonas sp. TaxID=1871086 RepID=UPI003AF41B14
MRRAAASVLATALLVTGCGSSPGEDQEGALRVLSLDQCADQYVLALGEGHDLALSPRADDPDSWLRAQASGHRTLRPTLESVVAYAPDVVVRYWGGDARLLARLERQGVTVVTIADAADFASVEQSIAGVAQALDRREAGQVLIARMRATLRDGTPPGGTRPVSALYLTAGGFTSGRGTLIDASLQAAGLENAAGHPGFGAVRVERLAMHPPERFALGFYDQSRADRRGPGRHPLVKRLAEDRPAVRLPAAMLTCPAWFMAEAVPVLAGLRDAR